MGKIITIQFRRSRPPRRLNDDRWLEWPPARPAVVVFPKRHTPKPKAKIGQPTLVASGK
jgi:hypothetical protein